MGCELLTTTVSLRTRCVRLLLRTIEFTTLPTPLRLAPGTLAKRSLSQGTYTDPSHYMVSLLATVHFAQRQLYQRNVG